MLAVAFAVCANEFGIFGERIIHERERGNKE
jgi:hypothetical protein